MPNNPYDDLIRNLARLIEQITGLEQHMHNLQDSKRETPQIIGCAFIAGTGENQEIPCNHPAVEVGYEIVDAGETAYLTLALPSSLSTEPCIEFAEKAVHITAGTTRAPVELSFRVVPESCFYSIRNGIVDATLVKATAHCETSES
ncbi:MAG TPA: hypothetical protein VN372_02165 [Methanospirillum sp.]|nr:hypothetical protein [Methanospirillum sp.]